MVESRSCREDKERTIHGEHVFRQNQDEPAQSESPRTSSYTLGSQEVEKGKKRRGRVVSLDVRLRRGGEKRRQERPLTFELQLLKFPTSFNIPVTHRHCRPSLEKKGVLLERSAFVFESKDEGEEEKRGGCVRRVSRLQGGERGFVLDLNGGQVSEHLIESILHVVTLLGVAVDEIKEGSKELTAEV